MDTLKTCPRCFSDAMNSGRCLQCGFTYEAQRSAAALPLFSTLNGRYLLGAVLGAGGFGITYSAVDFSTGGRVAIKECFLQDLVSREPDGSVAVPGANVSRFKHAISKFYDEASILYTLRGHRSIVSVHDYFYANATAYMAMVFVDGVSLKKVAEASPGATDIPIMENIFLEVAMALQPIHSLNLLHRDISPDNILIMSDDSVKLIDFGAARYVSSGKGSDLSVILKPGFAPYEQYSSKGVQGPWTDIYALAGTIYYCLVGKKIPDAISRLGVTREFSNIIDRCLRVSGAERYQSVTELISDYKHTMLIKSEPLPQPKPILKGKSVFAQIVSGAFDGYLFKMEDSGIMNIGRSSRMCDAVIPANDISRLHCRVIYDKASGALLVTDLSSLGTYRENGTRLPLNTAVRVGFLEKIYLTNRNYTLQFTISYKN